jgi:hypothetical protein
MLKEVIALIPFVDNLNSQTWLAVTSISSSSKID